MEVSDRFSVVKLKTALPQLGHDLPVTLSTQRTFERWFRSETSQMIYFSTLA